MADAYTILTLSPGSTSTKVAVFKGDEQVFKANIKHTAEELAPTRLPRTTPNGGPSASYTP